MNKEQYIKSINKLLSKMSDKKVKLIYELVMKRFINQ